MYAYLDAIKESSIEKVKQFLMDTDQKLDSELIISSYNISKEYDENKTDILELLLSDIRFDPSTNNNYFIRNSIYDNIPVTKLLLNDHRCDPTVNDNECIRFVCKEGNTTMAKLLCFYPLANKNAPFGCQQPKGIIR